MSVPAGLYQDSGKEFVVVLVAGSRWLLKNRYQTLCGHGLGMLLAIVELKPKIVRGD